jgi:hypothetical protein
MLSSICPQHMELQYINCYIDIIITIGDRIAEILDLYALPRDLGSICINIVGEEMYGYEKLIELTEGTSAKIRS